MDPMMEDLTSLFDIEATCTEVMGDTMGTEQSQSQHEFSQGKWVAVTLGFLLDLIFSIWIFRTDI